MFCDYYLYRVYPRLPPACRSDYRSLARPVSTPAASPVLGPLWTGDTRVLEQWLPDIPTPRDQGPTVVEDGAGEDSGVVGHPRRRVPS